MDDISAPTIHVTVLALGAVVTIFVVLVVFLRRWRGTIRSWASRIRGNEGIEFGKLQNGRVGREAFQYLYYAAANKRPPSFLLFLPVSTNLLFSIRPEGAVERFFKRIGINQETQVGDRAFDDRYYIVTGQDAETRRVLFDAKARQAVERLFAAGFTSIRVDGGRIEAIIQPYTAKSPLIPELLESTAQALLELRKGLPGTPRDPSVRPVEMPSAPVVQNLFAGPWTLGRVAIYLFALGLEIAGIVAFAIGSSTFPPLDGWELYRENAAIALVAFVVFVAGVVIVLRGRAESHKDVLLILFFGVIGVPFAVLGAVLLLNGQLDTGPATEHEALVVDRYFTNSKNSTYYHVELASWRIPGGREEIEVNRHTYGALEAGRSRLSVITRPGHLGYEWVEGYRLVR